MPFITKKINNLSLNYETHFGLKRNEEFFEINPGQTIKEITILGLKFVDSVYIMIFLREWS